MTRYVTKHKRQRPLRRTVKTALAAVGACVGIAGILMFAPAHPDNGAPGTPSAPAFATPSAFASAANRLDELMGSDVPGTVAQAILGQDADDQGADNITANCTFDVTSNASAFHNALDGRLATVWTCAAGNQSVAFTVPKDDSDLQGIYVRWAANLIPWELDAVENGKAVAVQSDPNPAYYAQWIPIPAQYRACSRFILVSKNPKLKFSIAELSVYNHDIPYYVPQWQPYNGQPVDTMVISCHPDDEDLYMGAGVPLTVNVGKTPVVVTMTAVSPVRRIELQESVWSLGETICPVFRMAKDEKTFSLASAQKISGWSEQECLSYVVEQIRKYKPSVILTHDIRGEYGHGAHMLTSYIVREAVTLSGDAGMFPDSAAKYGIWTPKKLYVHLYKKGGIFLDAHQTLGAYGGRTLYQVISRAYERHKSQLPGRILPIDGHPYDLEDFGLYWSAVGPDTPGNTDLFEHVKQ